MTRSIFAPSLVWPLTIESKAVEPCVGSGYACSQIELRGSLIYTSPSGRAFIGPRFHSGDCRRSDPSGIYRNSPRELKLLNQENNPPTDEIRPRHLRICLIVRHHGTHPRKTSVTDQSARIASMSQPLADAIVAEPNILFGG